MSRFDWWKAIGVVVLVACSVGLTPRRTVFVMPTRSVQQPLTDVPLRSSSVPVDDTPSPLPPTGTLHSAPAIADGSGSGPMEILRARIASSAAARIEPIVGHYNSTAGYCAALSGRYDASWLSSSKTMVSAVVARCRRSGGDGSCGHLVGVPVYHAARVAAGIPVSMHAPLFGNRIRKHHSAPVLVVPTDAACEVPSGVLPTESERDGDGPLLQVVPQRSLPSPTCDAFMTMWCSVLFNGFNETADPARLEQAADVWRGQEDVLNDVMRLWLGRSLSPYIPGRLDLNTMYPRAFSSRTINDNPCAKTGHPQDRPRVGGKGQRHGYLTAEATTFVLHDVHLFQGNFYHKDADRGGRRVLQHAPQFNKIAGRWPSDAYSQRPLLPLKDLAAAVAQSGVSANVSTIAIDGPAVWFPPTDMEGGYHVVADGLLNHFHAVRHVVARNVSVAVVMQAAHRSFSDMPDAGGYLSDCSIGWAHCLGASNPSELKHIVLQMTHGAHNAFVTRPAGARSKRPAPKQQSATVLRIQTLFLGSPSNCEPHGAIEANLLENFEGIQYSRSYLDCDATLWVWRRAIFEATRSTILPGLGGVPKLLMDERRLERTMQNDSNASALLFRTVDARELAKELVALPDAGFLDSAVDPDREGIHIVMLFRSPSKSRSVPLHTRDALIQRFEHALLDHPLCEGQPTGSNGSRTRRCSIRFGTFGGIHDAALLLATATVAIMPHGYETINIALLRPNAIVVLYDSVVPLYVPFVPLWLHWQATVVNCAPGGSGRAGAKSCHLVNHLYGENKYRMRSAQMTEIVDGVLRMVLLQRNGTTLLWYDFQP